MRIRNNAIIFHDSHIFMNQLYLYTLAHLLKIQRTLSSCAHKKFEIIQWSELGFNWLAAIKYF